MALITVSDITTYMDITFTNVQEDAAQFVIDGLQAELEAYLRRPVEQAQFTEVYTIPDYSPSSKLHSYYSSTGTSHSSVDSTNSYGYHGGYSYRPPSTIYLENSPIIQIDAVVVLPPGPIAGPMPAPGPGADYLEDEVTVLLPGSGYIVRPYGIDLAYAATNHRVVVTYKAGLDGENIKVFKLLMLRAATREMQNMHDDVVGIKDLTTRNVAPLDTGFSDRELQSVKRYRRVRVS